MKSLSIPIAFHPVYKDNIWGGSRIPAQFHRENAPAICAESWEISGHPDGMGVVADGPLTGLTMQELCLRYGAGLVGTRAKRTDRFPLLVKLIDARDKLSLQVHPSFADPSADPLEIKNECWHILDRTSDACLYAGFRLGVTDAILRESLAGKGGASLLNRFEPAVGETLYIRAGLVHAIGAGCLVYEVQQTSNTTYRLYDWDRVGPDGKPRLLHIDEGLRSVDWSLPPPKMEAPRPVLGSNLRVCVSTPFFTLLQLDTSEPETFQTKGESFHVLFARKGSFTVSTPGGEAPLPYGSRLLIPASADSYTLIPSELSASALITHL